jgi:pyrophosphatase PpaX
MALKYILFDFDGTIADTNEIIMVCLQTTAEHAMGRRLTDDELDGLLGRPLLDQTAYMDESRAEELVDFYRSKYKERRDEMTALFPGMYDLLSRLKSMGYKLAVVSNKNIAGIEHGLEFLHIGKFFDTFVASEHVENKKPHPEPVITALENLNGGKGASDIDLCLQETVMIGDSIHDIECGRNAGCMTILVSWTIIDMRVFSDAIPTFIADSPEAIMEFVSSR